MKKKYFFLTLLVIAALVGGYLLFYKHAPKYTATTSADMVVMVDKKRAINTAIWEYVTQPKLWDFSSSKDDKDERVNWKDALTLPDYLFAFHEAGQPNNTWHTTLEINDKQDFEKYLVQENFKAVPSQPNVYQKDSGNLYIGVFKNTVLLSNANEVTDVAKVYSQLFNKAEQLADTLFSKLKDKATHVSFYAKKGTSLKQDVFGTLHYAKNKITLNTALSPLDAYTFKNENLSTDTAMLNVQFAQPNFNICNLLDSAANQKFKNLINVPAQDVLLPSNTAYSLQLQQFVNKIDTAITYEYDDDFNQVEKKTITTNREPQFTLNILGNNGQQLLQNLQKNKVVEATAAGNLFTSIPFAKTYASTTAQGLVLQTAATTKKNTANNKAVFFSHVNCKTLLPELGKYLNQNITSQLQDVGALQILAQEKNGVINIVATADIIIFKK
jgi:hypothetical protein